MTTENQTPEQDKDLDIGSALENATEEQLNQAETFEEFMAQQGVSETQETDNQTEPDNIEPQSNPEQKTEGTTEGTEETHELTDAEFRQLVTSSFRANHQDVQVDNPDDIRKLMQFGMNYHKKMGELAPYRKYLKSLDENGLLSPDKINFMIDLLKGDKAAVAKFLKDQSIDTYELPDVEETPYQQKDYLPTDARIAFDEKKQELESSEYGRKALDYIRNLDQDSFYEVYTNPVIMDNLARHAENGLMADTLATLEKEYALGNVPANVKPLDAYGFVAQQLEERNPSKYSTVKQQQRVLGNNIQNQVVNNTRAPASASIPNGGTQPSQQQSYSGVDLLLNASEEDLGKYSTWEEFIQANNINF